MHLGGSASSGEAFQARSSNGDELLQRCTTRARRDTSGARDGAPADDHNHCPSGWNAVGGDLTLRRPRMHPIGSNDQERAWVDHRAVTRRTGSVPMRRNNEAHAVRPNDPPAAARHAERGHDERGEKDREQPPHLRGVRISGGEKSRGEAQIAGSPSMLTAFFSAMYSSKPPSRTFLSTQPSYWSRVPSKRINGTP
jgi:hypothetical protein